MPQNSKYSDSQFDGLTQDIISVLERHQAGRDLSLMVLGNLVTQILNHQIPDAQRQPLAEQFTQTLLKSVQNGGHAQQTE